MVLFQQKKLKMQSLIIHDLCTTGESSYFICGTKWTCTQAPTPFTEWEHKLQQHLSQVMVHMVAIWSIKQKQNFQHLLKHKKKPLLYKKSFTFFAMKWRISCFLDSPACKLLLLLPRTVLPQLQEEVLKCESVEKSKEYHGLRKRQNYAGQSKLVSIEQLSCSLIEVWGQTTKQLEKQLRFFFYFVCINV